MATTATSVVFTKTLPATSATSVAASQSPGAGAITLNGSAVVNGVAILDTYNELTNSEPGINVAIASGGDDSGITFTVYGTNSNGQNVSDTFAGAATDTAISNIAFNTVTRVTHTGSVAGTVTVGTTAEGASRWITWDYLGDSPFNLAFFVQVSGTVSYTVQYTLDDPNNLSPGLAYPVPIDTTVANKTDNQNSAITTPIIATRVVINSGSGMIRARFIQAGIG